MASTAAANGLDFGFAAPKPDRALDMRFEFAELAEEPEVALSPDLPAAEAAVRKSKQENKNNNNDLVVECQALFRLFKHNTKLKRKLYFEL